MNWLRVFEAAARFQHFARAAEALHMSPPAVSQQIRALEQALGRELFERGPHSVRLTEAGRAFLPSVMRALHDVEQTATSLFGAPGGGTVSVRCSSMMAESWLAPRIIGFERAHPDIQIILATALWDDDHNRTDADLHIAFGAPPASAEEGDRLFGETIYPVALPATAAAITQVEDFYKHRLIEITTHRANWQVLLTRARVASDMSLRMTYTDTTSVAFAMAGSGFGVALARAPATDHLEALYGLQPCLEGLTLPGLQHYYLTYPTRTGLSRAAGCFRDWLLAESQV